MRPLVIDPGVWISAIVTPTGVGAQLLAAFLRNQVQVYVSPQLLDELAGVLARPKFRRWCTQQQAEDFVKQIAARAELRADTIDPPAVTRDRKDDYLVALAHAHHAVVVSGDKDLIDAGLGSIVLSPRAALDLLDAL